MTLKYWNVYFIPCALQQQHEVSRVKLGEQFEMDRRDRQERAAPRWAGPLPREPFDTPMRKRDTGPIDNGA
jgi:ribosomal protein L44E